MTVIDTGDVDLVTDDDLTVTITSEEGVIHVDGAQDLTVNVEGDIIPGGHVTAGGDANVTAKGDITNAPVTAGDEANVAAYGDILNTTVKGDSVSLTADADGDGNGAVGTKDAPILTDTASGNTGSGSLSANGTEVYVTEMRPEADHSARTARKCT